MVQVQRGPRGPRPRGAPFARVPSLAPRPPPVRRGRPPGPAPERAREALLAPEPDRPGHLLHRAGAPVEQLDGEVAPRLVLERLEGGALLADLPVQGADGD